MSVPSHLLPLAEGSSQSQFRLGTTVLAILAGLVVDIGGTMSSETFVMAKVGLVTALAHLPFSYAEFANPNHDPFLLMAGYFHGMSFSFAGAYLAAVIGWNQPVLNATLFGVATTVSGFFFMSSSPLWFNVLCLSTIVPLAALAGYMARRTYR